MNTTNKPRHLPTVKSQRDLDTESGEEDNPTTTNFKHPKGFKELRFRVNKFTGDPKEVDLGVWLEDFRKASGDCGWNDTDRAKWFSWFLSGPAKSTWQQTLKSTHKGSWPLGKRLFMCIEANNESTWIQGWRIRDVMSSNINSLS